MTLRRLTPSRGLAAILIASSAGAQSSGIAIDDSLFQPIRLPETMAFGYPPNESICRGSSS